MKKTVKFLIAALLLCSILISTSPIDVLANSAEPPSVVILVKNPSKDLLITLLSEQNEINAKVKRIAWEGTYVFYSRDMKNGDKYTFKVTSGGESFEVTLSEPVYGYNNIYTLEVHEKTLTPGKYPFRSILLVGIRLFLTLLIESIIFLCFRFRQKRSWLIFLAINLVTQGILNIWLNNEATMSSSYLIFALIFGELFVFASEMVAFPALIKEHSKRRTVLYAFIANLVSLIVGGYLITLLPV
ncbi:MAG: hypothetical protein WBI17_09675 [Clostridiaceae bacterium]